MSDDFLHRIRIEPPADFLAGLKSRLDKQPTLTERTRRGAWLRGLAVGLLFGGSVFAITLLTINGLPRALRDLISSADHEHRAADGLVDPNGAADRLVSEGRGGGQIRQGLPLSSSAGQRGTGGAGPDGGSDQGPTAGSRRADAVRNEGASETATNTAPKVATTATDTSGRYSWTAEFLTLKSLEEYATRAAQGVRSRPNMKTSIKVMSTSTEALATLCKPDTKSDWPPGVAITTRRITSAENDTCARNIGQIREIPLGIQAIVIVRSKVYSAPDLSPRDVFLALAAEVPDATQPGVFIPNPYTNWSRINGALENEPIEVLGPPRSSMTGMALVDLLLEPGCRTFPEIVALQQSDRARYEQICTRIRSDGVYVETDEAPYRVLPKLQLNPNAIGIGGYSLLTSAPGGFVAARIGGVTPSPETISAGSYPASRPVYAYVGETRGLYSDSLVRFAETQGHFLLFTR